MVERQHDAAGADAELAGDHRQRGAEDGGVGVEATEGMEMTLGRPDGGEAGLIGESRAFEKEMVFFVLEIPVVAGEVEETEIDLFRPGLLRPGWRRLRGSGPSHELALLEGGEDGEGRNGVVGGR